MFYYDFTMPNFITNAELSFLEAKTVINEELSFAEIRLIHDALHELKNARKALAERNAERNAQHQEDYDPAQIFLRSKY